MAAAIPAAAVPVTAAADPADNVLKMVKRVLTLEDAYHIIIYACLHRIVRVRLRCITYQV